MLLKRLLKDFSLIHMIALVLGAFFFILATQTQAQELKDVFAGISASFVFLLALDGGRIIQYAIHQRDFRMFFGNHAAKNEMYLVYSDFVLIN